MKRNILVGSKDVVPRKKMGRNHETTTKELTFLEETQTSKEVQTHKKINELGDTKISINYCNNLLNQIEIIINNMFDSQ